MTAKEVKIGQKFIYKGKTFLRIDFDLSKAFLNSGLFDGIICVLDLNTYKVVGLLPNETNEIVELIEERF